MTIDEAFHRVVRGHWLLILLAVILPVAGETYYAASQPTQYQAVSRIQVGTSLASSNTEADAASTRTLGIATSPGLVESALSAAHVGNGIDPVQFAANNIDVQRVGVSTIMEIAVTDTSAVRAANINKAITNAVLDFANAGDRKPETARIEALDETIVSLGKTRDQLIGQLSSSSAPVVIRLQAQIGAIQTTLADDLRQRSDLIVAASARSNAVLLDAARTPTLPLSKGVLTTAALALLLGLVGGLGLAALWEALRPVLRGPRSIALALGAPVLGHVSRRDDPDPIRSGKLEPIADRMALLARKFDARRIVLLPVRTADDPWADEVADGLAPDHRPATMHRLPVAAMDGQWRDPGRRPAAVIFTPVKVRAKELEPARELLESAGWPLLGVVTYDTKRARRRGSHERPPADRSRPAGPGPDESTRTDGVDRTRVDVAAGPAEQATQLQTVQEGSEWW